MTAVISCALGQSACEQCFSNNPETLLMLAGDLTLDELPRGPNIKLVDWAPQNDVLGHPSTGAFVTQGGANSMHEAIFHAVPVVVIALTADQPAHAVKVSCAHLSLLEADTAALLYPMIIITFP